MKNTSLCYIENDGKYLMMHRTKNKSDGSFDKWIGIGGKFELGESPDECMKREVLEETGLKLEKYSYRGIVTFVSDIYETEYMHLFTSNCFTGNISDTCEEGELVWVEKEDLYKLAMWEGDKIFLNLIASENQPFFSLKLEYRGDNLQNAYLNGVKM